MTRRLPSVSSLLIASTPVGPVGSGKGGGVEQTLALLTAGMRRHGIAVTLIAPRGSVLPETTVLEADGPPQPYGQYLGADAPVLMPRHSVLAEIWRMVRRYADDVDIILNLAYDWLPFYLSPFINTPVAHFVTMGRMWDVMDDAVAEVAAHRPGSVACYTRAQAETFARPHLFRIVGGGIDVDALPFVRQPSGYLVWSGRIAPEKGVEDAVEVASRTRLPLKVIGLMQDRDYFERIAGSHPHAQVEYAGFLDPEPMGAVLGGAAAMLATPKWVEAFGNVVAESLACGTPVIAYRRGGPAEIVEEGRTGFLVEPENIAEMARAVERIDAIDRQECRNRAVERFSADAFVGRVLNWLNEVVGSSPVL